MTHDVLTQLQAYARQLEADAEPLSSLVPARESVVVRPLHGRMAAALAAAVVVVVIGLAVLLGGRGGDDLVEEPDTFPASTSVPATSVPLAPTAPTTVPSGSTGTLTPDPGPAGPPLLVGYNAMGSAPFVFVDAGGLPGAFYNNEWLYDSSNALVRCFDETCSELESQDVQLAAGSWLAITDDGVPLRVRTEVDDRVVPRQSFGQLPEEYPDPPYFAPASIAVIGCTDASCSDRFQSTVLEVTTVEQIMVDRPDAVPYPGGGKVFIDPTGSPWILYSGVLVDGDLIHRATATALIRCGDPQCTGSTIRIVYQSTHPDEIVFNETLAYRPDGTPVVTFLTADVVFDELTGVQSGTDPESRVLHVAVCADPRCLAITEAELDIGNVADPVSAVDGSGRPMIVWEDTVLDEQGDPVSRRVLLTRCEDPSCTSHDATELLDLAPDFAWNLMGPSLVVGADGAPLVTAVDWTGERGRIHIARCEDPDCARVHTAVHEVSGVSPATLEHVWSSAAAFDPDGVPIVAYYRGVTGGDGNLRFEVGFLACADALCSTIQRSGGS